MTFENCSIMITGARWATWEEPWQCRSRSAGHA